MEKLLPDEAEEQAPAARNSKMSDWEIRTRPDAYVPVCGECCGGYPHIACTDARTASYGSRTARSVVR